MTGSLADPAVCNSESATSTVNSLLLTRKIFRHVTRLLTLLHFLCQPINLDQCGVAPITTRSKRQLSLSVFLKIAVTFCLCVLAHNLHQPSHAFVLVDVSGAASFSGTKNYFGNRSLFAGIPMIFPVIFWASVEIRTFVPRKGNCYRAHVRK